jgi:hypothetical protein
MTQFLLIESPAPHEAFADLVFANVDQDPFLAEAAAIVFSHPFVSCGAFLRHTVKLVS